MKYAVIGDNLPELIELQENNEVIFLDYQQLNTNKVTGYDCVIIAIPQKADFPREHIMGLAGYLAGQGKRIVVIDPKDSLEIGFPGIEKYLKVKDFIDTLDINSGRKYLAEKFVKYLAYAVLDCIDVKEIKEKGTMELVLQQLNVEEMSQIFGFGIEDLDDGNVKIIYKYIGKKKNGIIRSKS